MDYTVIYPLYVTSKVDETEYRVFDSDLKAAAGGVRFPMNQVIASIVEDGSNVRVIMLGTELEGIDSKAIANLCRAETAAALDGKDCNIEFIEEYGLFDATRSIIGQLYASISKKIIDGSTILADLTYGPKYISILVFSLLSYAERFAGCRVDNIVYGQVHFVDGPEGKRIPVNPKLYDIAPLYLASSFSRFFGGNRTDYDSFIAGLFKEEG